MKYVYKFRNLVNGKVYVGQTYDPAQRKAGHLCAARNKNNTYPLPRSMRKHGINNFVFEIIEECDDRLINEREKFWITELDSRNPNKGYNLHVGGRGQTTSSRRKLSEALKGNKHCVGRRCSAESRYKMGSGNRGKHWNLSDETKRKLSVTSSGTRNYMYGKKGVDCPNSKLTREQLDDIRTRIKIGESFRSIAKNLNVSHQTISRIAK